MCLVPIILAQISIKLIKQISKIENNSDDNQYHVRKIKPGRKP